MGLQVLSLYSLTNEIMHWKTKEYKVDEYFDGDCLKTVIYCYLDNSMGIISLMRRHWYEIIDSDYIWEEWLLQVKLGQDFDVMLKFIDKLKFLQHKEKLYVA